MGESQSYNPKIIVPQKVKTFHMHAKERQSELFQMVLLTYQSSALKEAIDDLEWPGSSVQISLQKSPPCVTFRGEGHGDLRTVYTLMDLIDKSRRLTRCIC
ncbi:unnamed protein product [Thlaspi arvense]|uniref:Uncharacterized protein n=1 Tax=Thlaspi arvense TaxID=13288 RepID=A0AAU9T692_THLAR|nr:unnamed protein product [Thlaspi arvense]